MIPVQGDVTRTSGHYAYEHGDERNVQSIRLSKASAPSLVPSQHETRAQPQRHERSERWHVDPTECEQYRVHYGKYITPA
jgi:hypothetical protein